MSSSGGSLLLKYKDMALGTPFVLSAAAFLFVAYIIRLLLDRPPKLDLPVVGDPSDQNWEKALIAGAAQYPDSPFVIPTSPPTVIIPRSLFDEIRLLPENKVSFRAEVRRSFVGEYTGLARSDAGTIAITKTVKNELFRNLAGVCEPLQDEIRYGLDKEMGPCEEWTSFELHPKVLKFIALLSGRIFIGRPLSRNQEWLDISIKYTVDLSNASQAIKKLPWWQQKGFFVQFVPEVKAVSKHYANGARLLKPLVEDCVRRIKEGKSLGVDEQFDDTQGQFMGWLMKYYDNEKDMRNVARLTQDQLAITFAAIHTTSMTTTEAILNLVHHPECIAPLREEIDRVIQEDGFGNDPERPGVKNLKKESLPKLRLLDSFLKENQRTGGLGMVSNARMVMAPLKLSSGHTIPAGTRLAYNSLVVNRLGPKLPSQAPHMAPLSEYSPFRYATLREVPGEENKHQFVTLGHDSVDWGYGNHSCPGRFFAGNEVKITLIELLMRWDFRLPADEKEKGTPARFVFHTSFLPNPMAKVEFRRRKL